MDIYRDWILEKEPLTDSHIEKITPKKPTYKEYVAQSNLRAILKAGAVCHFCQPGVYWIRSCCGRWYQIYPGARKYILKSHGPDKQILKRFSSINSVLLKMGYATEGV